MCWKLLKKPITIFYKVFVSKHVKEVEETVATWTYPTLVTKNAAIDPINNIKLFQFLSSELMYVRKRRNDIVKEKKQLDTENKNLAMKESNLHQLLVIISS